MKCKKCSGNNFNRVTPERRYRKFYCEDCDYHFYFIPSTINKNNFCKLCGEYIKDRGMKAVYCLECAKIRKRITNQRDRDKNREREILYGKKYRKEGRRKYKLIICRDCGKLKKHVAFDLCGGCYTKWYRLNNKLKDMPESDKDGYLRSRGLLDDKRGLSIDDLKKDLGVNEK